jgi:ABC-2 type transport system permease protein
MDLVLHTTRYGMLAFLRNKKARMFTLIFPLVLLGVFAGVFNGGETTQNGVKINYAHFFVPSVIVFTLTTTTLAMLVAQVVQQREVGILKRRRATPLPAWALIVSQSLTVVGMAIGSIVILLLVAGVAFGIAPAAAGIPALALGVLLGCAAFCGLGYALSTFADSADAAQPMIQVVMLPLFFISGVWVPTSELPPWLNAVASVFPVEHVADLVHRGFVGAVPAGPILLDAGVLVAWALVGVWIAANRFVWLPTRKG